MRTEDEITELYKIMEALTMYAVAPRKLTVAEAKQAVSEATGHEINRALINRLRYFLSESQKPSANDEVECK